mmetsp:Transcript_9229/g.13140  ORF Transcript_9229/g.13140 Transcript_9229/m.13140 type:complete len:349 (+) Transcript_9229:6225-7271(+)
MMANRLGLKTLLLASLAALSGVTAFSSSAFISNERLGLRPSVKISAPLSLTRVGTIRPRTECWASSSNDKINYDQDSRGSMKNGLKVAATTAAVATVAAMAFPQVSMASPMLAESMTSISGGAGAVATSTSVLLDKLSETGFYQAFSLVFLSEIGDKTFFIAGLLAMKTSKLVSFVGSIGALAVMTVISVLIGQIFHQVPAGIAQGIPLDDVAAVLAFTFFGLKTLKEAFDMDSDESVMDEEFAEAEEAVEGSNTIKQITASAQIISTFGLVFAAEFGDRSFLATIALGAAQNPVSVAAGAIAAHAIATGIAVVSGSYIAKYISEKVIGIIGGTLFLVFAATTALGIF